MPWNQTAIACALRSNEPLHRPHIDEHEKTPKPKRQEYSYSDSNLWRPSNPTVVYVGTIPFGLAVIEMTEAILMRYVNGKYIRESEYRPPKSISSYADHTWTTTKISPVAVCGLSFIPR